MCNRRRRPPRVLTMEPLLLPPPAIVQRMPATYQAMLPSSPPTALPKSVAQFSWTLLPSKTDMPGSTLQAISAVGRPAVQFAGPKRPWPSSNLLWPTSVAAVIVPIAGVCKQCHHHGEPVQAGGVLSRPCPHLPGASRGSLKWCRYCHRHRWLAGRTTPTPQAPTAAPPRQRMLTARC